MCMRIPGNVRRGARARDCWRGHIAYKCENIGIGIDTSKDDIGWREFGVRDNERRERSFRADFGLKWEAESLVSFVDDGVNDGDGGGVIWFGPGEALRDSGGYYMQFHECGKMYGIAENLVRDEDDMIRCLSSRGDFGRRARTRSAEYADSLQSDTVQ